MLLILTISSIVIWSVVSIKLMKRPSETGMAVKLLCCLGVLSTVLCMYILGQKLL